MAVLVSNGMTLSKDRFRHQCSFGYLVENGNNFSWILILMEKMSLEKKNFAHDKCEWLVQYGPKMM